MAETGFGSVSFTPSPIYADWGFGSPTPYDLDTLEENIVGRDTAFGSPYDAAQSAVFIAGEFTLIPDDGGVILEINNSWENAGFYTLVDGKKRNRELFPFEVNFIDSDSGDVYPAIGERLNQCTTNFTQTKLYAGVPPLPHGTYDVKIEWFSGTRLIYIDNAFTVGVRPRCRQAYGVRQHLPEWFNTGVRRSDSENIEVYNGFRSNLEMLTKCLGDSLQRLYGVPTTALTSSLSWGDTEIEVESTIGFPDAGALFVGTAYYTYTGKTEASFTGVAAALYHEPLSIRAEVSYDQPIE